MPGGHLAVRGIPGIGTTTVLREVLGASARVAWVEPRPSAGTPRPLSALQAAGLAARAPAAFASALEACARDADAGRAALALCGHALVQAVADEVDAVVVDGAQWLDP